MKVTLNIKLENGMTLPVAAEVVTFADIKKLGNKLSALPANANKLIPGTAELPVKGLSIEKE